jgi:hypothetical protein
MVVLLSRLLYHQWGFLPGKELENAIHAFLEIKGIATNAQIIRNNPKNFSFHIISAGRILLAQ